MVLGAIHNRLDFFAAADIAGINSQPVGTGQRSGNCQSIVEMNVGDQRNRYPLFDVLDGPGRGFVRSGQVAARSFSRNPAEVSSCSSPRL